MFNGKIENLWLKLLLVVLIICGIMIVPGYLYYMNSSCPGNVWNCFEFEIIMLGGGILLFSLPLIVILFFWELMKKIKKKREDRVRPEIPLEISESATPNSANTPVAEDKIEPEDRLSRSINKYMK